RHIISALKSIDALSPWQSIKCTVIVIVAAIARRAMVNVHVVERDRSEHYSSTTLKVSPVRAILKVLSSIFATALPSSTLYDSVVTVFTVLRAPVHLDAFSPFFAATI